MAYRQEFRELFDANFGRIEAQLEGLRTEMRAELNGMEARVDARLEALKSELLRWMFLFWVGTMGTVLAILKL